MARFDPLAAENAAASIEWAASDQAAAWETVVHDGLGDGAILSESDREH